MAEPEVFRPTDTQYFHLIIAYLASILRNEFHFTTEDYHVLNMIFRESEKAARAHLTGPDVKLSRLTYELVHDRLNEMKGH